MTRVGAIVQARMGSHRLPGKSLRPIKGRPTLDYVLERLHRCSDLSTVVIATSTDPQDDALASYAEAAGVACVRGPLDDVAGRFVQALGRHPMEAFVRVCGDRPLLDQSLVTRGITLYGKGEHDVVTNACPVTFPAGQTVEVVKASAFVGAYPAMDDYEREHVTPFFYRNAARFRIHNFEADRDYAGVRLVLDTEDDARVIEGIVGRMRDEHWTYGLDAVADLYRDQTAR